MSRNSSKATLEDQCREHMDGRPDLCDDNTHILGCIMVHDKFGMQITPEIVRYIASVDRARRKVLSKYPKMDQRKKHRDLEENDRKYYGGEDD